MTNDEIRCELDMRGWINEEAVMSFARAIIAKAQAEEREACAKVCEDQFDSWKNSPYGAGASICAAAIRARKP